jgi:hypothetical protein
MAVLILVALGWIYVVLMMVVAEATAPNGTFIGAFFTLLLYGALPLSIVLYVLATPMRRRARRAAEAAAAENPASSGGPDPPGATARDRDGA